MTRRILLDVTELLGLGLNTGVQRVVRELYAGLSARDDTVVAPVIAIEGRLSHVTPAALALLGKVRPSPATATPPPPRGKMRRRIEAAMTRVPTLFSAVQQRYFRRRMPAMLSRFRQPGQVTLAPGDVVVAADTFWTGSEIVEAAGWARAQGASVITLVYDMIPYTHPGLAGPGLSRSFPRLLRRLLKASHGVLTISHFSAAEIARFLDRIGLSRPVGVFYLGSDAGRAAPAGTPTGVWPEGLWAPGTRTALTVGTIEPRKGHDTILAAFSERWQAGSDEQLLMIGKSGAGDGSSALRVALDAHPERDRRLFVLGNVDDAMLADAYTRADVGIIASVVEGFGLPLVEALVAGLPMIASDIPVFRELAGNAANYFGVGDSGDLVRVLEWAASRPRETRDFSWPNWNAAVGQLHERLIAMTDAPA